jgi:hypothetical protein
VRPTALKKIRIESSEKARVSSGELASTAGPEQQVKAELKSTNASNGITGSASSTGTNKSRSTLGLGPLIHPDEHADIMSGTRPSEVMADLKVLLAKISQYPSSSSTTPWSGRKRHLQRHNPHAYVIKWVDYTNRYGVGYVLDDGSVGCVFKSEHGRPASGVVIRDGELHIRRKALAKEGGDSPFTYSESNQLVPRNGKPVEFYENIDSQDDVHHNGGIKRVVVNPDVFEVKNSNSGSCGPGIKSRCEAEKVKRVKLVDQFGKYMIGALGRGGDEEPALADEGDGDHRLGKVGEYVKFYQRLGNVGIWGFGDGAFQVCSPFPASLSGPIFWVSDLQCIELDFGSINFSSFS